MAKRTNTGSSQPQHDTATGSPTHVEREFGGLTREDAERIVACASSRSDEFPTNENEALAYVGRLIDCSDDLRSVGGIQRALEFCEQLLKRDLSESTRVTAHYFLANAFSLRRDFTIGPSAGRAWDDEDTLNSIKNYRIAYLSDAAVEAHIRVRIRTNLANFLSGCGRTLEAIEYWDLALEIDPDFAMANGNIGVAFITLAQLLEDGGHIAFHVRAACEYLGKATSAAGRVQLHPNSLAIFERYRNWLKQTVPAEVLRPLGHMHADPDKRSEKERAYRYWCRRHKLFVNDLNDVVPSDPTCEADVLSVPSIVTKISEPFPAVLGLFSQMKQEYVSARFLCYEGLSEKEPHFSDRDVTLIDTFDYTAYSLAIEKMKIAFRLAYSLLDKLAFLVNHYFALQVAEHGVSFRTIWYTDQKKAKGIRTDLPVENLALRGLFWLAKDLSENHPGFIDALEPDARQVAQIRNHLEHKYLKVHEFGVPPPRSGIEGDGVDTHTKLAYSVSRTAFERMTLRLLKTVRCALVYTTFAIRLEEARRRAVDPSNGQIVPIPASTVPHKFKR